VALGRTILGKPANAAEARAMLARLSGRTHRVLTSVVVGTARRRAQVTQVSRVTFAAMTAAQIKRYVDSGEPMGKAGAYAVQGGAAAYISHISGSYSGIMGLPVFETSALLKSFGLGV
jgi:septum formation protein